MVKFQDYIKPEALNSSIDKLWAKYDSKKYGGNGNGKLERCEFNRLISENLKEFNFFYNPGKFGIRQAILAERHSLFNRLRCKGNNTNSISRKELDAFAAANNFNFSGNLTIAKMININMGNFNNLSKNKNRKA